MGTFLHLQFFLAGDFFPLVFLALLQQTPRMQLIFVFPHFLTDVSFAFFCSVQTPVPTPLDAICRNVSCFPTAPASSGVTFATFLLPFFSLLASSLGPLSLSSTVRSFFTFAAASSISVHPNWDPLLRSIHLWPHVPLHTAGTASSDVIPDPSSNVSSPSVPAPRRAPLVRSCQFSPPRMPNVSWPCRG